MLRSRLVASCLLATCLVVPLVSGSTARAAETAPPPN